jgi:hypothetical protein
MYYYTKSVPIRPNLAVPEVKELTIQFEDPDVDRLIENIMRE